MSHYIARMLIISDGLSNLYFSTIRFCIYASQLHLHVLNVFKLTSKRVMEG